jgi:hypothetical protein
VKSKALNRKVRQGGMKDRKEAPFSAPLALSLRSLRLKAFDFASTLNDLEGIE